VILSTQLGSRVLVLLMALALASGLANGASLPPLPQWLPRVGQGFDPQNHGQAAWSAQYDYFRCDKMPAPAATPFANFDYAVRGCRVFTSATAFVYGQPEPVKGRVVYDASHRIILYQEGCCAWRNAVLASGIGPPPSKVHGVDLSGARTNRGIALGMTQQQVTSIYGRTTPHSVPGAKGVTMLSYTTMHGESAAPANACGQFENFAFRNGKLFYIELLAGC
jgi:hypothetical protein